MKPPTNTADRITQTPDLSAWLTKQQASDAIQVSSKTIEKLAMDGKLNFAKRPQKGSPPQTVYHADDVKREAEERQQANQPGAFVVRAPLLEVPEASSRTALTRPGNPMAELTEALLKAAHAASARPVEHLTLSVKEAAELSGLSQVYLKWAIKSGLLQAIKDGRRTRIRRKDLGGL